MECRYEQAEIVLVPGDVVVLYTDGISEAMNPAFEEWGEKRIIDSARETLGLPAREITARIMGAANAFASGAPQSDDMTLVVLSLAHSSV